MTDLIRLADQNIIAVQRVTDAVTDFVTRSWWAMSDYHSADQFVATVVPHILGGQVQIANLTDAYMASLMSEITGAHVAPIGLPVDKVSDLRNQVTLAQAYERPLTQVWFRQSQGMEFPDALKMGLQRAQAMVSLDMQLARTHASSIILQQTEGVTGYQRVLSGSENCKICEQAAKTHYSVDRLMPIHSKCDCTTSPIINDRAPLATSTNKQRSTASHSDMEFRGPVTDVRVEDHQELGPMLLMKQLAYNTFSPGPNGTWEFDGKGSASEAGIQTIAMAT